MSPLGVLISLLAVWLPPGVAPVAATDLDGAAVCARARATVAGSEAGRGENFEYRVGDRTLPVRVRSTGADVRASVSLDSVRTYDAGRTNGREWRADANGIAHFTRSDAQADAVDRLPWSRFAFELADCSLVGQANIPAATWVLADRTPTNYTHYFFIEKDRGRIVREETREGQRVDQLDFDDFANEGGIERARAWRVRGARASDDIDVRVASSRSETVAESDVQPSAFSGIVDFAGERVALPAHFRGREIVIDAVTDGHAGNYVLDTGTASITIDNSRARGWGRPVLLEHARVATIALGEVTLHDVSTLAIPFGFAGNGTLGILGYDFFFGSVVHIDYARERVELLRGALARRPFEDATHTIVPIDVDEGLPLAPVRIGALTSNRFALDTGSPRLFVLQPFSRVHQAEIARLWTPSSTRSFVENYLEGSIELQNTEVAGFDFGGVRFTHQTLGVAIPSAAPNALEPNFDGIVGTDELAQFELWFDYDRGQLALARAGSSR